MKVVVDANVILSALLSEGVTRERVFTTRATLCAPGELREEVARYRDTIAERADLKPEEAESLLEALFAQIRWIPEDRIEASVPTARKLLGDVDPDDVAYLACALSIDADAIWSHDADFDEQDRVLRTIHPDEVPR